MRLLADRPRLERVLRVVALLGLVALVIGSFLPRMPAGTVRAPDRNLETFLADWSRNPLGDTIGLVLGNAPSPDERDWLRALQHSGSAVVWSDDGVAQVMIEVEPRQDPAGGATARVTGAPGTVVRLEDELGLVDSVTLGPLGATTRLPPYAGRIQVIVGQTRATAAERDSQPTRSVVVLGLAGWETNFVARALSERGWVVESRMTLAPGLSADVGRPFPLDTARHVVVIALDSMAGVYSAELVSFVNAGGGLILGPTARRSRRIADLLPGSGGTLVRPAVMSLASARPRAALGFRNLAPLTSDAAALETEVGGVAVAIRRAGAARVLAVGYEETWRWRLQGGAASPAMHRAWWSDLVALAAFRSLSAVVSAGDPAPRVSLMLALGAPSTLGEGRSTREWYPWLLALVVVGMLGEWTSRRLRGGT